MSEYLALEHNRDIYLMVHPTSDATGVRLRVQGSNLGEGQYAVTDSTLRLLLVADLPDGTRRELATVTHPYDTTVARSALPAGGWVSLSGEVLTGTSAYKFRANPWYLGTGASKVPSTSQRLLSSQLDAGRVDWLEPPQRYAHPDIAPYALKPIPSQNGVAPTEWVCERPWGAGSHNSGDFPRWRRIGGQVRPERVKKPTDSGGFLLGPVIAAKPYFPTYGGVPGLTNTTPYGTVRGHPSGGRGPQWIEIDGYGRFWGYNRDGSVIGMAGYRMPPDNYEIPDETLSTWRTVGSFPDGPLNHPHDFAYDFIDRKYVYVADTDNHRLVRISRHAAVVQGQPEDFSRWVLRAWGAAFSHPTSVDTTLDGRIYVVDNEGLWSVNRDTGAKTRLHAHNNLFWVRCLSNGLVCTVDRMSNIYRVDPATGQVTTLVTSINTHAEWPLISPDLGGHVGPRDSLYLINGPHYSYRIDLDGTVTGPMYFRGSSGSANVGDLRFCVEAFHYAWNCEVHQEEPYVFTRGFSWSLPALYRPKLASESYLSAYDPNLATIGRLFMRRGTIEGLPWGARPSVSALMSDHGYTGLGVKQFDQIQALPLAERVAYIKAGMGGSVPRPELVGEHLRGVLYWVWRNSSQFVAGAPLELPPPDADRVAPSVLDLRITRSGNSITWTWRTDKPALCYVRFADRLPMYRWTPLENTFGTTHTATARHVDADVHFQVCALGANGVLAEAPAAHSGGLDTTPPRAPTGLRTS